MKEINIFPFYNKAVKLPGISILDSKEISFEPMNGIDFTEISALAYDEKKGFFALSDRGNLFTLSLKLEDKKIKELKLIQARSLLSKKGKHFTRKKRDSEGMDLTEDGLVISFELTPKVSLFDFDARKIRNYEIIESLKSAKNYRSKNKALEAVLYHPELGVITAPEAPLKHLNEGTHTLYSLHKRWNFQASGKITALELLEDKNILVLEREFSLLRGHHIVLKKVFIQGCGTQQCDTEILASLKSTQGWTLDNFEGLTHIKENIYLMVSDDNGNFFQKCLIVLFEVI